MQHKAFIWGIYVDPAHRKQGLGRRLMQTATQHGFETLEVEQLSLGVNANNPGALALYESLGFLRFGLEKNFMRIGETYYDEIHMACTRDESRHET